MITAANIGAPPDKLDLVYGLGTTGMSIARYLDRNGLRARFVDSRAEPPGADALGELFVDAEVVFGETPQKLLETTARIIVSPGIPDTDAYLEAARDASVEILSDIELFAREATAPFIAVTGSNGKSTVTTLLAKMCAADGKKAYAGANLGVPALDLLTQEIPDFYLLELSSFQLQRTHCLPATVAVLLNVSPDHLDWHVSEEEYRAAKYRVFAEAHAAVVNRSDENIVRELPANLPRLSFGLDKPAANQFGLLEDGGRTYLARGEQLLLAVTDVAMIGAHNLENALAALASGELMGLEMASMLQVLREFPGLPHRMQSVARINGAHYVNDSKATNVGAAIAAVNSVADSITASVVLIAGGQGKGGDFSKLAISIGAHLRAAIFIGEDAQALANAFTGLTSVEQAQSIDAAVRRAASLAEPGDTVLLAPACASFDQYQNYQDRGNDFCRAVDALQIEALQK